MTTLEELKKESVSLNYSAIDAEETTDAVIMNKIIQASLNAKKVDIGIGMLDYLIACAYAGLLDTPGDEKEKRLQKQISTSILEKVQLEKTSDKINGEVGVLVGKLSSPSKFDGEKLSEAQKELLVNEIIKAESNHVASQVNINLEYEKSEPSVELIFNEMRNQMINVAVVAAARAKIDEME